MLPKPIALDVKNEKLLSVINPEKLRNLFLVNNGDDFANLLSTKEQVRSLTANRGFMSIYYAMIIIAIAITFNYVLLFMKVSPVYHSMIITSIPIAIIFIFLIHRWRNTPNVKKPSKYYKHMSIILIFLWLTFYSGMNLLNYPIYNCTSA